MWLMLRSVSKESWTVDVVGNLVCVLFIPCYSDIA
jgi:hypothetical protein